jgi:hypothetical protein
MLTWPRPRPYHHHPKPLVRSPLRLLALHEKHHFGLSLTRPSILTGCISQEPAILRILPLTYHHPRHVSVVRQPKRPGQPAHARRHPDPLHRLHVRSPIWTMTCIRL